MISVLMTWLLVALLLAALLYSGNKTNLSLFQTFLACLSWPWVGIRDILKTDHRS